jgi:inosose dehydratase
MSIRIGTAPVSWGVMEIDSWGARKPYEDVLDEMAAAGYVGTELGPYGYFPTDSKQLIDELSARGLTMVSGFVPLPLAHRQRHASVIREVMNIAQLLSETGSRVIVLADELNEARMSVAGRVTDEDGLDPDSWSSAVELLIELGQRCREFGLATVFHHHAGTYVETPAEIDQLCAATDPDLIGLCLDTGHYYYGGGNPLDAVHRYKSRIRHLHLKDVRPSVLESVRHDRIGYLDAVRRGVFCELGEGAVDFRSVLEELEKYGFHGWAIFEQDVDPATAGAASASALRSREYLRREIGV